MGECFTDIPNEQSALNPYNVTIVYKPNHAQQQPPPRAPPQSEPQKLQSADHKIAPFVSPMTFEDALKLSVDDKIDHRDEVGRFASATVTEKQGNNLKIHYDGWSSKWDAWSDFSVELHRFAYPGSISLRPSRREHALPVKKDDCVAINPSQRHPGWKVGRIRRLDEKSGQVQVVYEYLDKNHLYWAHLDDDAEIVPPASVTFTVSGDETIHDIIQKLSRCPSFKHHKNKYFDIQQMELFDSKDPNELPLNRRQKLSKFLLPTEIVLGAKYPTLKVPVCGEQDLTLMDTKDPSYQTLAASFHQSMKKYNGELLDMYRINKYKVDQPIFRAIRRSKNNPQINSLFHGTSFANAGKIIKYGFNRDYNKRSRYGYGTYLAASPATASQYCSRYNGKGKTVEPIYCMLVCRTIIGKMAIGNADRKINGDYDALVDDVNRPSIYVVHKDYHSIPSHLIVFKYN